MKPYSFCFIGILLSAASGILQGGVANLNATGFEISVSFSNNSCRSKPKCLDQPTVNTSLIMFTKAGSGLCTTGQKIGSTLVSLKDNLK